LTASGYYDWDQQEYSQHLSWQRAYDNLVISVSLFRYPESKANIAERQQTTFGAGYGGQLMIVYNH
jgi:hypothetical protein